MEITLSKKELFENALQLEILLGCYLPDEKAYNHYYSLYISLRYLFLKKHITGEYRQYLKNIGVKQ